MPLNFISKCGHNIEMNFCLVGRSQSICENCFVVRNKLEEVSVGSWKFGCECNKVCSFLVDVKRKGLWKCPKLDGPIATRIKAFLLGSEKFWCRESSVNTKKGGGKLCPV